MEKPNYTQMPNVLLDNLPELTDAELRVMLCMCRQTFGYHKDKTIVMSITFLAKATGMSQTGVIGATKSLMVQNYISRTSKGQSFSYQVSLEPLNGVEDLVTEPLNGVEGLDQLPLNGVEGKKESNIKEKREEPTASSPALKEASRDLGQEHKQFIEGWCELYSKRFGNKYLFSGPKDAPAVKRILSVDTAPSLLAVVSRALSQKDDKRAWHCVNKTHDIASFAGSLNKIRGELYNINKAKGRL